MERNQELFEKIELYLKGGLSSIEIEKFERELKDSPNLRREVELHRFVETEIKNSDGIAFRQKIMNLDRKKKKPFRWAVAASIIVLLGVCTAFWFLSSVDNSALFNKYYHAYPVEDIVRGIEKNEKDKIAEDYDNQEFDQVIAPLKLLILKEPDNELLKLYLGNAQLQTDQVNEAALVFAEVERESSYYEDAQWYLALSYLKLDASDKAILILKNIVKYNGRHKKNAEDLLNEFR